MQFDAFWWFWIAELAFNFLHSSRLLQDKNHDEHNFDYSVSCIDFSIVSSEQNSEFCDSYQ